MADKRQAVKSANRVLDLFELLGNWEQELSHAEIATSLKIPKSSLSQLMPSLIDRGYIEFLPASKGYRLGTKLIGLVGQLSQAKNLKELAFAQLEHLTEATGESSAVNVLKGDMTKVIASYNSPQRLVSHMRSGDLAPLYATSSGKVILAFLPDHRLEEYLSRVTLKEITKNTIRSTSELRRQMVTIRRERLAYSLEEFTPGIIGMATPILSTTMLPIGAVNVAMPAVRYNAKMRDLIADALARAASILGQKLGISTGAPGNNRAKPAKGSKTVRA